MAKSSTNTKKLPKRIQIYESSQQAKEAGGGYYKDKKGNIQKLVLNESGIFQSHFMTNEDKILVEQVSKTSREFLSSDVSKLSKVLPVFISKIESLNAENQSKRKLNEIEANNIRASFVTINRNLDRTFRILTKSNKNEDIKIELLKNILEEIKNGGLGGEEGGFDFPGLPNKKIPSSKPNPEPIPEVKTKPSSVPEVLRNPDATKIKPSIRENVAKRVGSSLGKIVAEDIPFLSMIVGSGFALWRIAEGDIKGALAEFSSGIVANEPGFGTALATAIQSIIIARDIYADEYGQYPEDDPKSDERYNEIIEEVRKYLSEKLSDAVKINPKQTPTDILKIKPNSDIPSPDSKEFEGLTNEQALSLLYSYTNDREVIDRWIKDWQKNKSNKKIPAQTSKPTIVSKETGNVASIPSFDSAPRIQIGSSSQSPAVIPASAKRLDSFVASSPMLSQNDTTPSINTSQLNISVGKEEQGDANRVISYFENNGWTHEQAAGIAANISAESSFKTNETGDNGQAYGLAQWHPDRQQTFERLYGKNIREASFDEQLAYINYELTQGQEKSAGLALRKAKSAQDAAAIFDQKYERSSGSTTQRRMQLAEVYSSGSSGLENTDGKKLNNQSIVTEANDMKPQKNIIIVSNDGSNNKPNNNPQQKKNYQDVALNIRLKQIFPETVS